MTRGLGGVVGVYWEPLFPMWRGLSAWRLADISIM
jgi:hypothetical protein